MQTKKNPSLNEDEKRVSAWLASSGVTVDEELKVFIDLTFQLEHAPRPTGMTIQCVNPAISNHISVLKSLKTKLDI